MANYISAVNIANKLGLDRNTVISRFRKLDIEPLNLNNRLYYLNSDVYLLKTVKKPRNLVSANERFAIVEYFLTHRNNSALDLETVFFISQRRIDRILSEYFDNGMCITVPSKLNKL
jgi:hypothetical protein